MSELNEVYCRRCACRMYWTGHFSNEVDAVCWGCAKYEDKEDAVIEQGIRQWEEEAAEVRAMIHDDERRS